MIDIEALLIQILLLGVFGVVYAWIGGKIGFKSGIQSGKKELFTLMEISPQEWKTLSPPQKRAKLTQIASSLIRDTLKQAAIPNPGTEETTEEETNTPLLPDPNNYTKHH